MEYLIGADIGATKTSFVLLKDSFIVSSRKIKTPSNKNEIIKAIEENIKDLISNISKSEISGIGLGIAGPLNKKGDIILNPPNLKMLSNLKLAKIIEKNLGIKTKMENDARCFTLAEAMMGAGKGCGIVLGITLGSGIGGGLVFKVANGKLEIYKGAFGGAAEIGHMVLDFKGPKCSCGSNGCFEKYASEKFIKMKSNVSSIELEERAKKGDKGAKKIYEEFGRNLGKGLANLVNILDPEIIVIGGGFAKSGFLILEPAKKEMKKRILSIESRKNVKIKITKLGDFAGALGAALLISL
ncbi:MAG: ROK family protein [Candidatus Nealsonbacteria bacterium]|nr:ROK family protein [Candidatus Nealsonbacteria bacterium]